jgi:hypothetical protein
MKQVNIHSRNTKSIRRSGEDMRLTTSTPHIIEVDPREVLSLDFGNVHAIVDTWECSSVRIAPNIYFNDYVVLLNVKNSILFDYESYLEEKSYVSERAGFTVKIPSRAALSLVAGRCFIRGTNLLNVKSHQMDFKNCTMLDNFQAFGDYVSVQNTTLGKHCVLNARTNVFRHCSCSTLILNGNRKYTDMSVKLRNVRGEGVWLGHQQLHRIDAHFNSVKLNSFVMEAGAEEGSVLLEGSKIDHIENKSTIPIKKNVQGSHRDCA